MLPSGLAGAGIAPPVTAPPTSSDLQVHLEDVLASPRRLWVRGRLRRHSPANGAATGQNGWWGSWRGRAPDLQPAPVLCLETEIAGRILKTEVPLSADGSFEACCVAELPPARRGWRITRHRLACSGQTGQACGVALMSPAEATDALVVLLPSGFTSARPGASSWQRSDAAGPVTELLRRAHADGRGQWPIYYLACVASTETGRQAELALAATALGWPAGHFVVLHADDDRAAPAFAHGLARLRWLFAGALRLHLLNLEPSLEPVPAGWFAPATDAAPLEPLAAQGSSSTAPAHIGARLTRATRVPRHPVVFCHGMLAMSLLRREMPEHLNYFLPLGDFLREGGIRVLFPQVAPTGGVATRAQQLLAQIQAWTREPVNLIAHSMGGLDARCLITHLRMANHVRSLTTICTPHHGSAVADWFCANFNRPLPLIATLKAVGLNLEGIRDCQRSACASFNGRTPDAPGVLYFSYGAAVPRARLSSPLRRPWNLLTSAEGPNDGLVSVASARWGDYLGTLAVDHFGQSPDGRFVRPGEDFDSLRFFSRLVEDLAWRGL
jgi:triacylglycerol lipase